MTTTTKSIYNMMTPNFVSEFSCIGPECADTCCGSWKVNVDKKAFKNLKKNENIIIRQLANENLSLTRESTNTWGEINLKDDGYCPFLDTTGWCEIHKQIGAEALPKTCQNYPKTFLMFGDQIEASISISCPTAAEGVLLTPSAFTFKQNEKTPQSLNHLTLGGYTDETLPAWMPILRDFCFSVILFDQIPLEHRLFSLGMALKQGEKHLDDPKRLQEFLATAEEMTADGSFSGMFEKLSVQKEFKWVMFANQHYKMNVESQLFKDAQQPENKSENLNRFDEVRKPMFDLIEERKQKQPDDLESDLFLDVLAAGNEKVSAFLANNEHILINYILYYLFHHQFMFNHDKTPFQFFKIMSVDLFMQRTYLAGIAEKEGELTKERLIQIFQTYARKRQHSNYFIKNMEIQLEKSNTNGAGDIFSLLK
ncbi:flagellin lysine-N-methylase [Thalassotalea piscium]